MEIGWLLPAVWVGLGTGTVVSSLAARHSRRAYQIGVLTVSGLWVGAGAGANTYFLARGDDYSGFADGAAISFVRTTWESVVVPHHTLFIGLLIAFEAVVGAMVLVQGRTRQVALVLLVAFNVALVSFGWGFLVWSTPMVLALGALLHAGRSRRRDEPAERRPPVTRTVGSR